MQPKNQSNNKKTTTKVNKQTKVNNKEKKLIKDSQIETKKKKGIHKFWTTLLTETLFLFLLEITVKLLLKTFSFDWSILRTFISSVMIGIVITTITVNMNSKVRKTLLIIFNFLITLYAWLQLGFMNYLGAFMSLGNVEQGTKITSYIVEFLLSYPLVLHLTFVPFILSILYFIFEKKITGKGYEGKFNFKAWEKDAILVVSLLLLVLFYYATITVSFMQNKYQAVSNEKLFKYPSNPSSTIKNFGTTMYLVLDIKGTLFGGNEVTYVVDESNREEQSHSRNIDDTAWEELLSTETDINYQTLNNYFINRTISDKNDYTGKFEGKNLITIMMESISEVVFHEEYKEYFPTLYKLYTEGITGVNNYSPRNNCATGESELTGQTSLYSIETTCTVNTYRNNIYPEALQSMMKNNGYTTSAYHDFTDQYYSRSIYENKLGSTTYFDVDDLQVQHYSAYKEWPSDLEFMEKAIPKFIDEDQFSVFMVTVSAHTPYIYNSIMGNKHIDLFKNLDLSTENKRYLSKVKELDLALELLLNSLAEKGKLDDTVIVLYGDHYPYGLSDKDYAQLAPYDTKTDREIDRTPFIIYNSETVGERIEKYTTPLDYTPTILNLFGIEYDPRLYMGHDVFSDYTDYAVFPDNSWLNADGYYDTGKGTFTSYNEESTLTDEEIIAINEEVDTIRSMSNLAIKKNYFKYLFDYFEEYKQNQEESTENESETEE